MKIKILAFFGTPFIIIIKFPSTLLSLFRRIVISLTPLPRRGTSSSPARRGRHVSPRWDSWKTRGWRQKSVERRKERRDAASEDSAEEPPESSAPATLIDATRGDGLERPKPQRILTVSSGTCSTWSCNTHSPCIGWISFNKNGKKNCAW